MTTEWNPLLLEQLTWHWEYHLRPRLNGLEDDEYFWEPVPGAWNVRRRADADPKISVGDKDFTVDFVTPEPRPVPVTTIAWRLAHIVVGVLGERVANHFDGPDIHYPTFAYAGTAKEALQQLDDGYERWIAGVRSLGEEGLARPCGPAEGPYAKHPFSALVLHINREVIHHGAEVLLLRDLYRSR